ncbi:hypothetical protein AB0J51_30110 [Micromonospora echinofusca]|uniref:hypothetical protein n=1 Tax=Micromonospora echinofusca TaxID=47858 RepID=UPI00343C4F08
MGIFPTTFMVTFGGSDAHTAALFASISAALTVGFAGSPPAASVLGAAWAGAAISSNPVVTAAMVPRDRFTSERDTL